MPTYDYECPKGHRFEIFQKMSDEPVSKCPECGAKARRKISGGAGFLFKGEGFYITDYRSDDYRKKASAEKGDSVSDSGGSSGGGSSKAGGSAREGSASGTASGSSDGKKKDSKASSKPTD
jgi:putative FmdB family regulatory protein